MTFNCVAPNYRVNTHIIEDVAIKKRMLKHIE